MGNKLLNDVLWVGMRYYMSEPGNWIWMELSVPDYLVVSLHRVLVSIRDGLLKNRSIVLPNGVSCVFPTCCVCLVCCVFV